MEVGRVVGSDLCAWSRFMGGRARSGRGFGVIHVMGVVAWSVGMPGCVVGAGGPGGDAVAQVPVRCVCEQWGGC